MLSKLWKTAAAVVLVFSLSACATANDEQGAGNNNAGNNNGTRMKGLSTDGTTRNWDNRKNTNYTSMHNNTRMEMDERIADAVADMTEVDRAYVLLTDKNAYIAVKLEDGVGDGIADRNHTRGLSNGTRMNGNRMNGVNGINGRSGAPAARADGNGMTDDVKDRIAAKVKQMAPGVNNVYVSANPDFLGRLQGYGDRFQAGHPIRGMVLEFNRAVERLFPNHAGDDNGGYRGRGMNR